MITWCLKSCSQYNDQCHSFTMICLPFVQKDVIAIASEYFKKLLRVRRVTGPLKLNRYSVNCYFNSLCHLYFRIMYVCLLLGSVVGKRCISRVL